MSDPRRLQSGPRSASMALGALLVCSSACVVRELVSEESAPQRSRAEAERLLARCGLVVVSPREALIDGDRGAGIPFRVPADEEFPPLPPHPAGYIIVAIDRHPGGASELWRRLRCWSGRRPLVLTVRRNPHLQPEAEWYESDLVIPPVR